MAETQSLQICDTEHKLWQPARGDRMHTSIYSTGFVFSFVRSPKNSDACGRTKIDVFVFSVLSYVLVVLKSVAPDLTHSGRCETLLPDQLVAYAENDEQQAPARS